MSLQPRKSWYDLWEDIHIKGKTEQPKLLMSDQEIKQPKELMTASATVISLSTQDHSFPKMRKKLKFFFRSQGFTLELTSCSCKKNSFLTFLLQPDHMCASQTQEEKRVSTRTEWLEIPAFRTPKYRSLTLKRERLKRSWERKGLPIV